MIISNILYYGIWKSIKLFYRLVLTKLTIPNARFIRGDIDLRGYRNMKFEKGFTCGVGCRIETKKDSKKINLYVGKNVEFNDFVHITAYDNVIIGDNVLLASKIYISDCTHGSYKGNNLDSSPVMHPSERILITNPIEIKNNVWIGEFVSILPGVTIGEGSIIGANSVVTANIPAFVIAVGSPATPIKEFNFETLKWEKISK